MEGIMNFKKFLDFNSSCPLCGEPLTLYMQFMDSVCFKGTRMKNGTYDFTPYLCKDESFGPDCHIYINYNESRNRSYKIEFSTPHLKFKVLEHWMYLFFLCNKDGFKKKKDSFGVSSNTDYDINIYKGCYYRSTPVLEFAKSKHNPEDIFIQAIIRDDDSKKIINSDEMFSMTRMKDNVLRVYMLNICYEFDKTVMYHYTANEEQRNTKDYKPNIFEKTIPLLKKRPKLDLANREKFLDRLDGWILLS